MFLEKSIYIYVYNCIWKLEYKEKNKVHSKVILCINIKCIYMCVGVYLISIYRQNNFSAIINCIVYKIYNIE